MPLIWYCSSSWLDPVLTRFVHRLVWTGGVFAPLIVGFSSSSLHFGQPNTLGLPDKQCRHWDWGYVRNST